MNRRWLAIGGTVVVVIAVVIFLIIHSQPKKVPVYQSSITIPNMQYADPRGDYVYYFSGSAFARYNPVTQATQVLSPYVQLSALTRVQWANNGVFFETAGLNSSDSLYSAATGAGLDTSQNLWWLYSYSTGRFQLVGSKIAPAQIVRAADSGDNYVYSIGSTLYAGDGSILASETAPISSIDSVTADSVWYELAPRGTAVLKRLKIADHSRTIVLNNARVANIKIVGDRYVVYVAQPSSSGLPTPNGQATGATRGALTILDTQTNKKHGLLSNFLGVISTNSNQTLYAYNSASDPSQTGTLSKFSLPSFTQTILQTNLKDSNSTIEALFAGSGSSFFIEDQLNLLAEYGITNKKITNPVQKTFAIQTDLYMDEQGFEIHYRPSGGQDIYNIDLTKDPYQASQQAALQYISQQGIDPNLINVVWIAGDGVTPPAPAVDTLTPPASVRGE